MSAVSELATEDALLRLRKEGYVIVNGGQAVRTARMQGQRAAQQFFLQTQRYKDGFRTPRHQGYVTPAPGVHELFEMRKEGRDTEYRIPEPIAAEWTALYDVLEGVARDLFRAISLHLSGSPKFLELLDGSTFRLIHYDRVSSLPPEQMQPILSDHTDSSFLTVAPKGTFAGLEVRDFASLEWREIETSMQEDDVLVFAGDCLSRLSNDYFRSVLHRPSAKAMAAKWPPRLSTPFFLRGRPDAILDVRQCNPERIGEVAPSLLDTVTVDHFADNVGGVRDSVPWKRDPYYATFRYD